MSQDKTPPAKDAGAEYAEIWGEAIHSNRHLRTITVGLGIAVILLIIVALLHDSTAARVGALFQLLVQDTTAQDFGLPSSAIRLRM